MATVSGLTAEHMLDIENQSVNNGSIGSDGRLLLYRRNGDPIDAGLISDAVPAATTALQGKVELATMEEVQAASDATRAVTPASLSDIYSKLSNTGWITSGIAFSTATGWTISKYAARRGQGRVRLSVYMQYTGATTYTAGTNGDLADLPGILTVPADWRGISTIAWFGTATKSGVCTWFTRFNNNGTVDITHGLPNAKIQTSDLFTFDLSFYAD